jgi:hypothetical protein
MDGIDLLKAQALAKRNAAILAAKRDYASALREIRSLQRKLNLNRPGRPRKATGENALLKATTVAKEILREGKPMSLPELTLEVQRRGCRPLDDPRLVAKAIRQGLAHYRDVRRDGDGRWGLVP